MDKKTLFKKALEHQGTMYGTTTIGSRGQLVIPAQARKDLGLKAGDQLLVMGRFKKIVALIKADQFTSFINGFIEEIENPKTKAEFKKQIHSIIKKNHLEA